MTRRPTSALGIPLILAAALILHTTTTRAQADDPAPYVLHVYPTLIQVPALVLNSHRKPLPPVALQKFDISLDAGPVFHPTQMRLEGDDPINLAILLDTNIDPDTILKNFPTALAALSPGSLHTQDRVSIYAVDCILVRSAENVPASATTLREGILHALSYPTLHGKNSRPACGDKLALWDSIMSITRALSNLPGRRVLLIVSNGIDGGSHSKWNDFLHFVNLQSVTVFGLRSAYVSVDSPTTFQRYGRGGLSSVSTAVQDPHEDLFKDLCELNGGMILNTRAKDLALDLQSFVSLLRNRYILEFPRSNDAPSGSHSILVTIPNTNAFITTAGVVVPLADAKLLADPNTVPSAPTQIKFGTRRPLDPAVSPH